MRLIPRKVEFYTLLEQQAINDIPAQREKYVDPAVPNGSQEVKHTPQRRLFCAGSQKAIEMHKEHEESA